MYARLCCDGSMSQRSGHYHGRWRNLLPRCRWRLVMRIYRFRRSNFQTLLTLISIHLLILSGIWSVTLSRSFRSLIFCSSAVRFYYNNRSLCVTKPLPLRSPHSSRQCIHMQLFWRQSETRVQAKASWVSINITTHVLLDTDCTSQLILRLPVTVRPSRLASRMLLSFATRRLLRTLSMLVEGLRSMAILTLASRPRTNLQLAV